MNSAGTKEQTVTKSLSKHDSSWYVIVHDDPVNLMQYVTLTLQKVFGYNESKAEQLMWQVHNNGKAVVWTGNKERAELYTEQLQQHQLHASLNKNES